MRSAGTAIDLSTIPAERVGWLITHARERAGLSRESVASALAMSERVVEQWEAGTLVPSVVQASVLADVFGLSLAELFPPRDPVEVDLVSGTLRMRDSQVDLDLAAGNGHVLRTYLDLVGRHRDGGPGARTRLRDDDLDVLARVLDLDADSLEAELVGIMGVTTREAATLRRQLWKRRMLLAGAGLAVAVLAAVPAANARADNDHERPASRPAATVTADIRIGEGIQIDNPDAG